MTGALWLTDTEILGIKARLETALHSEPPFAQIDRQMVIDLIDVCAIAARRTNPVANLSIARVRTVKSRIESSNSLSRRQFRTVHAILSEAHARMDASSSALRIAEVEHIAATRARDMRSDRSFYGLDVETHRLFIAAMGDVLAFLEGRSYA